MKTPFSHRQFLKQSALAASGLGVTLPTTKPCDDVFALKLAPG